MTGVLVLAAIVAGLLVNELWELVPWCARLLVGWSARLLYTDPVRASLRASEQAAYINDCPGSMLKLAMAMCFAARAIMTRLGRIAGTPGRAGRERTAPGDAHLAALGEALRSFPDVRALPAGRRGEFRSLAGHLGEILQNRPEQFGWQSRELLVADAAFACGVLVEDRDESRAMKLAEAAAAHARQLGRAHPATLRLRYAQGYILLQLGRAAEAERLLHDLYHEQAQALGAGHPEALDTLRLTGWALKKLGRLADAEAVFRDILAQAQDLPADPNAGSFRLHVRCMLAWVLYRQGRLYEAVRCYQGVVADRTAHLGPAHPDTLDARHSLAKVILATGDARRAQREFRRVAAVRRAAAGASHGDTLESRKFVAIAAARLGRPGRARRELRRVLTIQIRVLGPAHPCTADTRRWLSQTGSSGEK